MEQENIDIIKILNDTKEKFKQDSIKLSAKADFVDELIQFFISNNFKVVKETEAEIDELIIKDDGGAPKKRTK